MGAARKTCQVSDQLPQDQRQVDSAGEVRVQVRRGGVNRKRLLRDQGGAHPSLPQDERQVKLISRPRPSTVVDENVRSAIRIPAHQVAGV